MRTPVIRSNERARKAFPDARVNAGGDSLRLTINARFEGDLYFASRAENDIAVDCDGITIVLDPPSSARADGVSIDFVEGISTGFKIDNPNKPAQVKPLSVYDYKAMRDSGKPAIFFHRP